MRDTNHPQRKQTPVAPGNRRQTGFAQEANAAQYLSQRGLLLIESNFSCRLGEIDLIMKDGDTLVFVEVRYRTRADFMDPVTSVDHRKQKNCCAAQQRISNTTASLIVFPVALTCWASSNPTFTAKPNSNGLKMPSINTINHL